MRAIAIPYVDASDHLKAIYRSCAEGLIKNLNEVFPKVPILHITDDKTEKFYGCSVLRLPDAPLMYWRLAAHCYAHDLYSEILFTEPDVRFNENIMDVFDSGDFDIAIADRDGRVSLHGEEVTEQMPYTQGSTFSRVRGFWKDAALYCGTLDRKKQLWFGDMHAIAHVVDSGKYKVKILDAGIYNHIPQRINELQSEAKVVHYKGKRKTWLFPQVQEAA